MRRYEVGVVGLGVAGATVAMLLARQGHRVRVFEQTAEPGAAGAGVLLQPSGQMVLERLGLLERVAAGAEPIERLTAGTHRGKTLIDLPYDGLGKGVRAYGVHRGDLFMALYGEMAAAGVEVCAGSRVVRYEKRGGKSVLLDEAGAVRGEVDFLLGCDGARSAMRGGLGVRASVYEYPHGALWAIGRSERVRDRLWQVTHGTKRMCGLLPMGGGRCSLFWSLQKRELEAFYARGFEAWRAEAVGLCPEAEELLCGLSGFEETRFTTYYHVRMRRWFDDQCLLLGDAAHAMSPHLGQGINLALIDAYCFAQALQERGEFRAACERYEALRRRHLQVYAAVTFLLSPFFQSRGFVKGVLRDLGLPLMPRVGFVRRQMQLTMAGMRAGWLGGELEVAEMRALESAAKLAEREMA